ncbi:MAG: gas vesicle protein GvpG [Patescibacteria group bacterium]
MFILDDLILLPARGFMALVKKIHELAEAELTDESKLKEQLLRLQMQYEFDQISEKEYQNGEDEIMARLNEISQHKKQ